MPKSSTIAAALLGMGVVALMASLRAGVDPVDWSDAYSVGNDFAGPLLILAAAAPFALFGAARHPSRRSLATMLASVVLLAGGAWIVLDVPKQSTRSTATGPGSEESHEDDIRRGFDDMTSRVMQVDEHRSACDARVGRSCTPTEIATGAMALGFVFQAARDCRTAATVCMSVHAGTVRIEATTTDLPDVGIIRLDMETAPDGTSRRACSSLSADPRPDALAWTCGRGMFSEPPERGPLP